jgi:hypothetical protein
MRTRRNPADLVGGAIRSNTALRDWHPMRRNTDMSLPQQASWDASSMEQKDGDDTGSGIAWMRQIFSGGSDGEGAARVVVRDCTTGNVSKGEQNGGEAGSHARGRCCVFRKEEEMAKKERK